MRRLQTFLLVLLGVYMHETFGFVTPSLQNTKRFSSKTQKSLPIYRLFEKESDIDENVIASLPPSATPEADDISELAKDASPEGTSVLFINQQTKRILIEELGYRRKEVERLRPELAAPIVSKRLSRPAEGVPEDWMIPEEETSSAMLERLENESKYPLKFPLLAVSLILFGKGFGDALITIIKVNIDFPGASLSESFMGFPVLAIDFICTIIGAALGSWTWKNMKD